MSIGRPGPALVIAATYERQIQASLARVWENVFDWEHLPWLHARTFSSIELVEQGEWGWRVEVGNYDKPSSKVELLADRPAGRYVARTTEGYGEGNEVWTTLLPVSDRETRIEVSFHVREKPDKLLDAIGESYVRLYRELWDEDEEMMQERQARLLAPASDPNQADKSLGNWSDLQPRLPIDVEFGGKPFRLAEIDGEPIAYSVVCPHLLGPLSAADGDSGLLECPWHGYAFDPRSGRSCDGRGLRLAKAPRVVVATDTNEVWLEALPSSSQARS